MRALGITVFKAVSQSVVDLFQPKCSDAPLSDAHPAHSCSVQLLSLLGSCPAPLALPPLFVPQVAHFLRGNLIPDSCIIYVPHLLYSTIVIYIPRFCAFLSSSQLPLRPAMALSADLAPPAARCTPETETSQPRSWQPVQVLG